MYPTSATFKDKIKLLDRVFQAKLQIQHSQGDLDLTDADIVQGSLVYNEASQAGDDFTVGGVVASDLRVELLNKPAYADLEFVGATLTCQIGLLVDEDTWEWVPLGVFNVDEVGKTRSRVTIKAVDNLILFDKPYSLSQLSYPATLSQIFLDLCSVCDVLPESVVFPNSNYVVQTRPEGDLTCRDVLGYVAELAGCFARATRTGKIELTWYTPSDLTLTGANRFDFTPRDDVVRITGVMATVDDATYLAGSDGSGGGQSLDATHDAADFEGGTLSDVVVGDDGLELGAASGPKEYGILSIPELSQYTNAYELGWEFKVGDESITVTGLRLMLPNVQTRTANLWRVSDQAKLASIALTSVAGQWVEGTFDQPVTLAANTNYVVSAFSDGGRYASSNASLFSYNPKLQYVTGRYTRTAGNFPSGAEPNRIYPLVDIVMAAGSSGYVQSGSLVSSPIDLSTAPTPETSKISWSTNTPTGTSVTVATSLSTDGGSTWGAWTEATNGGSIPGITAETNLSSALLKYRVTLATTDSAVTPTLGSVTIQIAQSGSAPAPYLIDLSDNPLLQGDYETALGVVYNAVKDTVFHPFTSGWQGNPAIQAGDMLTQVDRDGNEYPTLVTHSTYKYRGQSTLEARGLPVTAKGFKGSTNKKLAGIIRKVEQVLGDRLTSLEQATLAATELIANMLGGHVIIEDDAIYICDAETLEESTKIWKWGAGGFGYSDDGGETYTTAITADGTIVAALVAAGLVTADMIQAGILQSQTGSTSINLNTGLVNIQNKVYFDPTKGEYIFDGLLSAKAINALKGEIDVVVSYTTITQVLAAEKGNISELTVDQLDTSDMVQRYLNGDTSNVNFIKIYGQNIEFIEATVKDGAPTAQLLDRKQRPLYWLDAERTGVTLDVTPYPVTVYQYDIENRKKLTIGFEIDPQTGNAIPRMTWGAGDQNDYAKGYILKDETGLRFRYQKASGDWVELCLGENGIEGTNASLTSLDIYSDGMISEYDDGTVYDWSWTKDGSGRITEITNNTTQKSATISWNAGAKP